MGEFITGKKLEEAVYDIIWDARKTLLIVSPYIKLDDYFKTLFDKHENNPDLHIVVVFGKNEREVRKSMSKKDFEYFKKFPNISIIYIPNLHAKYYGNETKGVITSINLYDYSFKNNIEFGVFSELSVLNRITKSEDNEAWNECTSLAFNNEVIFVKRPVYQTKKIIISLGRTYIKSDVLLDSTDTFYRGRRSETESIKLLSEFPENLEIGHTKSERPERESQVKNTKQKRMGYCIRTGEQVPFNVSQPMSKASWRVWVEYENNEFPENYCHLTGKKSFGQTSMRNPILSF